MKLVQSFLTKNPCYTAGRKITVKGLMLHSVGCPQPKASVFISSWNSPSYDNACVHGFIDGNDGMVYQTLPWNHRGWHCGSGSKGSGNNTHIGVEMCEPACIRYTSGSNFTCSDLAAARAVAKRTYEAAVELFAYLCKQYNLNPAVDGVIISHREGHSRGIASNHGDPEHLWKGLGLGYTMDGFRKDVNRAFFTPDGRVTDDLPLRGEIFERLKCCAVNNIPRKVSNILEVMKLAAQVDDFPPLPDRIHLSNGTLMLDGSFIPGKPEIVRSRLPVAYNPDAPKPERWLSFLDGLLYPEDNAHVP